MDIGLQGLREKLFDIVQKEEMSIADLGKAMEMDIKTLDNFLRGLNKTTIRTAIRIKKFVEEYTKKKVDLDLLSLYKHM